MCCDNLFKVHAPCGVSLVTCVRVSSCILDPGEFVECLLALSVSLAIWERFRTCDVKVIEGCPLPGPLSAARASERATL